MSITPIEDSPVPGQSHTHVRGPQQSPVDPVAAGLSEFVRPEAISDSPPLDTVAEGAPTATPGAAPQVTAASTPEAQPNTSTGPAPFEPDGQPQTP